MLQECVYNLKGEFPIALDPDDVQRMFEHIPGIISLYAIEGDDYRIVAYNPNSMYIGGFHDMLGRLISENNPPDDVALMQAIYAECRARNETIVQEVEVQDAHGTNFWLLATTIPIHDAYGTITHILTISSDITEQKVREEQQARTIAELSTPLLTISDTTMVMPLIGALDSARVQVMIQTLLQGVVEARAQLLILDITGVPVVDTQVANTLIQAAQSVRLLGAQVMLSGIRPEVAQILVGLGVDLRGIPTVGSLQAAIASSLRGR